MSCRARWTWWMLLALALALPLRGWAGLLPMGACHEALGTPVMMDHSAHDHPPPAAQPATDEGHTSAHHLSPCCVAMAPPLSHSSAALPSQAGGLPPSGKAVVAAAVWPVGERPPRA